MPALVLMPRPAEAGTLGSQSMAPTETVDLLAAPHAVTWSALLVISMRLVGCAPGLTLFLAGALTRARRLSSGLPLIRVCPLPCADPSPAPPRAQKFPGQESASYGAAIQRGSTEQSG